MARRDLTFRVFINSTFSNLIAEAFDCAQSRQHPLQERIFSRLRAVPFAEENARLIRQIAAAGGSKSG